MAKALTKQSTSAVSDPDNVPVRVVDGLHTYGMMGANMHLSLTTNRVGINENGRPTDGIIICARLRLDLAVARMLRDAIDSQLAIGAAPSGRAN